MRAAELERARRVDVDAVVVVGELRRHDRTDHVLDEVGPDHRVAVDTRSVLRGDEHGAQAHGLAVLVVERDLGLAVRAQVGHDVGLAHLGEALGHAVGEPDRQRHEVGRVLAGVAEHHPLVAGALAVDDVLARLAAAHLFRRVDPLGDVRALLVDRDDDTAGVAVEAVERVVVADRFDDLAGELRDVDVGVRRDLAGHHAKTGREQRLAGHPPARVLGQDGVEDGIGDLVGHLVGMAFGDGLRGEGEAAHGFSSQRWVGS